MTARMMPMIDIPREALPRRRALSGSVYLIVSATTVTLTRSTRSIDVIEALYIVHVDDSVKLKTMVTDLEETELNDRTTWQFVTSFEEDLMWIYSRGSYLYELIYLYTIDVNKFSVSTRVSAMTPSWRLINHKISCNRNTVF